MSIWSSNSMKALNLQNVYRKDLSNLFTTQVNAYSSFISLVILVLKKGQLVPHNIDMYAELSPNTWLPILKCLT